jgi:uncharacterized membrane protein
MLFSSRFRFLGLTDKLESRLHRYFISETGREITKDQVTIYVSIFRIVVLLTLLFLSIDLGGHYYDLPLGTYGDFFGGVVNPFLTCASLIALAMTILMQGLQLKDAKAESNRNALALRKQAFESSFFNMLDLHNKIVPDLKFDIKRLAETWNFKHGYQNFANNIIGKREPVEGRHVFDEILYFLDQVTDPRNGSVEAYELLQKRHNDVLGHYFRNLYQILKFIDKTAKDLNDDFEPEFYSSILRAQLSANELRVLLYNCSGEIVDSGRFRQLITDYRILEHLPLSWNESTRMLSPSNYKKCDRALYKQYFKYEVIHGCGQWTGGAFGENPAVVAYLRFKEKENAKKTVASAGT